METIRAREDFDSARAKAFRRAIRAALTRRKPRLLSLDSVLAAAGLEGKSFGGVREIPLDRVVGSAAAEVKAEDFDPGFLPINRRLRDRWTRIYRAMVEGDELPPIDVYKLDDYYYVIDGHHQGLGGAIPGSPRHQRAGGRGQDTSAGRLPRRRGGALEGGRVLCVP